MNSLIIVAGNTTSDDFAPAANDHGFVYAVDFSGNWVWGKFYYNQSYAVQTISGCQLDAKNRLIIYGTNIHGLNMFNPVIFLSQILFLLYLLLHLNLHSLLFHLIK